MGLFSRFKKTKKDKAVEPSLPMYLYDDSEIEVIDNFICDMFGNYKNVFHEIASPDIHLDVCIALTKWRYPRSGRSISSTTQSM